MATKPVRILIQRGWLTHLLDIQRQLPNYYRVAWLGAGLREGLLQQIGRKPSTVDELVADLGLHAELSDGLASWLDLGVTLRELAVRDGRYRLRGRRVKSLVKPENDPMAATYEEFAELDIRLVAETPRRLRSGEAFVLTDAEPSLIARSSRIGEAWIEAILEQVVPAEGPVRLVEVGPGSGVHIRSAANQNPQLTALAVELQEPAAEQARANLARWGLSERVRVETGDIRDRTGDGRADLLTLHQNIYYFREEKQAELVRHLRTFLKPGGTFLATTIVRGGISTSGLDLWGAMTTGASRLPDPDELVARLREAGLVYVECRKIGQDGMYRAFIGREPHQP